VVQFVLIRGSLKSRRGTGHCRQTRFARRGILRARRSRNRGLEAQCSRTDGACGSTGLEGGIEDAVSRPRRWTACTETSSAVSLTGTNVQNIIPWKPQQANMSLRGSICHHLQPYISAAGLQSGPTASARLLGLPALPRSQSITTQLHSDHMTLPDLELSSDGAGAHLFELRSTH